MTIAALLAGLLVLFGGAVVAPLAGRSKRLCLGLGAGSAILGGALGAAASLLLLIGGEVVSTEIAWSLPLGSIHVGVDPLSSFFLICIFALSALSGAYGAAYLGADHERRPYGTAVAAFNLLVVAMAVVVLARDGVLFLFAWELMAIASFLLVRFEDERAEVESASFLYLVASHFGTAFLFLLFTLLAAKAASFDFDRFEAVLAHDPGLANVCFVLALVGFGTKAGLWPLHFWLPEAHPAAPSHVSAVMSGVMIKLGIYGLLRLLTWVAAPPAWWGVLLLGVAALSAVTGALYALAARDLKRMLAYSTIENAGVITFGIGIGVYGLNAKVPAVAALGFAGALLHVWNHGLFKSVLFQAAGSVTHAAHTRDLEALGGLMRPLPATGACFLTAALAASALPPLNGFVSEWLIYLAAFEGALGGGAMAAAGVAVISLLALVGGLAAACFVRAFGVAFLGEPRSEAAEHAEREETWLAPPMWVGAGLCIASALAPTAILAVVAPAVAELARDVHALPASAFASLRMISVSAAVLIAISALAAWVRSRLLATRDIRAAATWGCGYPAPSPTMQYSASSFAEPVIGPFGSLAGKRASGFGPNGYFPETASYEEAGADRAAEALLSASRGTAALLSRVTALQLGRIQIYLLYVLVTLIALLLWWLPR